MLPSSSSHHHSTLTPSHHCRLQPPVHCLTQTQLWRARKAWLVAAPAQTAQTLCLASLSSVIIFIFTPALHSYTHSDLAPHHHHPGAEPSWCWCPLCCPLSQVYQVYCIGATVLHRTVLYCTVLYTCDQPTLMSSLPRKAVQSDTHPYTSHSHHTGYNPH